MTEEPVLSPEEQTAVRQMVGNIVPEPEDRSSIFKIFERIISTKDTTKVGNLTDNELNAVRTLQNAGIFCEKQELDVLSDYFASKAEVVLATSDSRTGFLVKAMITQRKESRLGNAPDDKTEVKKKWYQMS